MSEEVFSLSQSDVNPNPDFGRIPDPFEEEIQGFVMTRPEMEDAVRAHIASALKEMGLGLRELALRGGKYGDREQSINGGKTRFLETVFEYDDMGRGISEDEVSKYINKYHPMAIEGIVVTVKPLNDRQSGSFDDYWKRFVEQREANNIKRNQDAAEAAFKEKLKLLEVPAAPPVLGNPNDTRTKDVMAKHDFDVLADIAGGMSERTKEGVKFSRDEISQLAAALGTTNELAKGGWILPDGRLLNFIRDGVRRDEKDIGIGFTEERKDILAKYQKAKLDNLAFNEIKDNGSGLNSPSEKNGMAQSNFPPNPEDNLAKNEFSELYPSEALKGGLIRYSVSDDGDAFEIEAYSMPTQGQFDVLEDIHEWIKFVNEGGYDKKKDEEKGVKTDKDVNPEAPKPPVPPPPSPSSGAPNVQARDSMDEPDAFEEQKILEAVPEPMPPKDTVAGQTPREDGEHPSNGRMIIVFVGEGDDDWWDYESVADVQNNLVKDLRTYFRDGKKPNEDFKLPEDIGQDHFAQDAALYPGDVKMQKRGYRPRSTLLGNIDYEIARRIARENASLIRTIPHLDIVKAEQKILGYFRLKITREQLARYFYNVANGAISIDRARFIADDQIAKATERMLVEKWRKNGITMVRWVHSGLSEPRPYHRTKWNGKSGLYDRRPNGLDGFIFPIDHPPVINLSTGERGYPGQLPNCRCHLEPVV